MKALITVLFLILPSSLLAQTLSMSIRPLTAPIQLMNSQNVKIFFGEVDALGISPNRIGDVKYDSSRKGAFYDVAIEISTEVQSKDDFKGELSVTRSRAISYDDIPNDALYDSDYSVKLGPSSPINLIDENKPYIIQNDIPASKTKILRKIGVFISQKLPPGFYKGSLTYTFQGI